MTPYDRWLRFIARPHSESGLTFPTDQANAIMALPIANLDRDRRWQKRQLNRTVKYLRKDQALKKR